MAEIHSTAIVRGDVSFADDVTVGPSCVLDASLGPISIGAGTTLIGNVYLNGPLTIGIGNAFYPFTCIGFAPQDFNFDPDKPACGTAIGDHNVFREFWPLKRMEVPFGATGKPLRKSIPNRAWSKLPTIRFPVPGSTTSSS